MQPTGEFCFQADAIVVSPELVYAPGQLIIRSGRIQNVCEGLRYSADANLEGYALLPGLVNPHTHLEFSDLGSPLPTGADFTEWISNVLAARRARGDRTDEHLHQSLASGLRESRQSGVAALVDIVSPPWTPAHLAAASELALRSLSEPRASERWSQWPAELRSSLSEDQLQRLRRSLTEVTNLPVVVACLEQLGLNAERVAGAERWRDNIIKQAGNVWPACLHSLGISPHAPYSTDERLWRSAVALARDQQRLLAMHLVESPAEREWIDYGTGPFAELHSRLGVGNVSRSPDLIVELCRTLAQAPRALIVHGNFLNRSEMEAIASIGERLSVAYCPRTHQHFQHPPYPLEALAALGIRVVFGTDSRSTNPDLNLWQDARCALEQHSSLRPTAALSAITQQAAQAIGLDADYGSLNIGRVAAINVLPLDGAFRRERLEETVHGWFERCLHPVPLY